ncbi:MAG: TonB-dependent receptor [Caulobacteraceae bacterium]|nr:TonB-dependent receptor [Caulobacteraceae bacterium]
MNLRNRLLFGAACVGLASASGLAMAAAPGVNAQTGTEGADVQQVVITAERNTAAATAPSKASLLETQPQSIITHTYIEQATPEAGDYTTTVLIAPSVAGVSSNGGGVGDANTSTLRGFQDGQYNITYDGIAFGDANDTTHHPAAFFPSSTIGATVVDRGPGAAGDMGQANFGGAIHLFSPNVSDKFGASQKATYGSFDTQSYVTQIQTGEISQLHDAKLLLNFDELSSNSELSLAHGVGYDQMGKLVVPVTSHLTFTAYASYNFIHYNQTDTGAGMGFGVTGPQWAQYGKNFALDNIPTDEHYYKFNFVNKHTLFSYADLKWDSGSGLTIEDQLYNYFYKNQTVSADGESDLIGGTNKSAPMAVGAATDIGGYHKLNMYRTVGDIVRVNQDLGFGTLRMGGLVESSWARRYIVNYDLTTGAADNAYTLPGGGTTNVQYNEPSSWFQYQLFADFAWRPTDQLTITPGIKYLDYTRYVNDAFETTGGNVGFPVNGHKTYTKPLYFLTINDRLTHSWSVYAQVASALLIPPVKTLTKFQSGLTTSLQPEQTITYQIGTVYTAGRLTADFDLYAIHATDVLSTTPCVGSGFTCYVNSGVGDYKGVEGEAAYAFDFGLTAFANGSLNAANNPVSGQPTKPFTNAPKETAAAGVIYAKGPWMASLSNKLVGPQYSSGTDGNGAEVNVKAYNTLDGSVSYDFGRFKAKVAAFNLFDRRSLTDFDGTYYTFQVGRQVEFTLEAKF